MEEAKAWEKRPTETVKAYQAFLVYLRLVDHTDPSTSRSLNKTSEQMGYSSNTMVDKWSSENDWVARAEAYDLYMQNRMMVIREASIEEFQEQVITDLTASVAMVEKRVGDLLIHADTLDSLELMRLVNTIEKLDNLKRRAAQLPINYKTERVNEPDVEHQTFILGD